MDPNDQQNTSVGNTSGTTGDDNTQQSVGQGTDPNAPKYPGQFWPNPGEPGYDTSLDPNHDDFFKKPLPIDLKIQLHEQYYAMFQQLPEEKRKSKIKIPKHDKNFDEDYFIWLISSSISLEVDEKKQIIEKIPQLSQFQIDELIKIFEEEKYKFMILNTKNNNTLNNFALQQQNAWEMELQKKEFEKQKKIDEEKLLELQNQLESELESKEDKND